MKIKMKSITVRRYINPESLANIAPHKRPSLSVSGWLFVSHGLRMVVYKEYTNSKLWTVLEYTTGRGLGFGQNTTRKQTIASVIERLDRIGSLVLCRTINAAIAETGIMNN